jgi:hypothetical protein
MCNRLCCAVLLNVTTDKALEISLELLFEEALVEQGCQLTGPQGYWKCF